MVTWRPDRPQADDGTPFFGDARRALACKGFKEIVFADDLNTWKAFVVSRHAGAPHEAPLAELSAVQTELHLWGAANQVVFDLGKESMHILAIIN